jgi:hypothetical protein
LWGIGVVGMLLLSRPAFALHAGISIEVHQDVQCTPGPNGNCPNDFHIEGIICSVGGAPILVDHVDDVFESPNGTFSCSITYLGTPDPCYYKFVADWVLTGAAAQQGIPYCTVLNLGLLFDVDAANLALDLTAWWTHDGKRVGELIPLGNGGYVPLVGFRVDDNGGTAGQTIRIGNGNVIMPPEPGPPEIPIEVLQMDVVAFPASAPPDFRDLTATGGQLSYPWVPVVNDLGPIAPGNPKLMAPDSFFDVFLEIAQPGNLRPILPVVIQPGGFLVSRQLIQFTNNNGVVEQRWDWEIHGAQAAEACCFDNGSCQDLAPFDCLAAGGVSKGVGTTCADTICLPLGACCYGMAAPACTVTDQATCEQQLGGQWKGVGTNCDDLDGDGVADVCEQTPAQMDFGDAPEGTLAYPSGVIGQFPTCITVGPATWIQHTNFGAWFGPMVDFESDGNGGLCPSFAPYDNDECMNDGDAGLMIPGSYTIVGGAVVACPQSPAGALGRACTVAAWGSNIDIKLQNMMPNQAVGYVNVLMDWKQDGVWAGSAACGSASAPEHVLVDFPIPPGFSGPLSMLGPPNFLIGRNVGYVWVRFSITERPVGTANWDGSGSFEDGETEDYLLRVDPNEELWDFGDAPDPTYPTLAASNGARHFIVPGMFLGNLIDGELDGQPNAAATGDDMSALADEDGVTFLNALVPGGTAKATVVASTAGMLDAWIDFGADGGWPEAGDQICASLPLVAGINVVNFPVPATAVLGPTFARFRFSSAGGLSYTGPTKDGEVEDYMVQIVPATIAGRYLFYNQSYYDGNKVGIDPAPIAGANNDDADAIDTSKTALLPGGGAATFANYTGYNKGINGLIYDIKDVPAGKTITVADFEFVNQGKAGTASVVVTSATLVTQANTPTVGTTRCIITFPNGSVTNCWLKVTVKATVGLATADISYWGNVVGEAGVGNVPSSNLLVNSNDEVMARPPYIHNALNRALVDDTSDYNKDSLVNSNDEVLCRPPYTTNAMTCVKQITR